MTTIEFLQVERQNISNQMFELTQKLNSLDNLINIYQKPLTPAIEQNPISKMTEASKEAISKATTIRWQAYRFIASRDHITLKQAKIVYTQEQSQPNPPTYSQPVQLTPLERQVKSAEFLKKRLDLNQQIENQRLAKYSILNSRKQSTPQPTAK